jgi:hypothetical protein
MYTTQTYQQERRRLTTVGFSEKQAEALMRHVENCQTQLAAGLATTDDIKSIQDTLNAIRNDITGIQNNINGIHNDIDGIHNDINNLRKEIAMDRRTLMFKQDRHLLYLALIILIVLYSNNWSIIMDILGK